MKPDEIPAHHEHWTSYESYLGTLSPHGQMLSMLKTQCIDISIVFGIAEKDRGMFDEHQRALITWMHQGYIHGEWRPQAGSSTAFFVAMVEGLAGGRPMPEHRDILLKKMTLRCMEMVKNANKRGKFVPVADDNEKRRKFLDDLDKLGGQGAPDGEV